MSVNNLSHEFYENGFQLFRRPELIRGLPLDSIIWQKENTLNGDNHPVNLLPEIDQHLSLIQTIIYSDYLAATHADVVFSNKRRMWEGVNLDATYWHNDGDEGPQLFFLLYYDDTYPDKGGSIHFSNQQREWQIQPKAGDLIAVNCHRFFFHRAEKSKTRRIVSSFPFYVS